MDVGQIGKRRHRFDDLAFRCDRCGIGFSNSRSPTSRRRIFRDPEDNVPPEVRDGVTAALDGAANVRNRASKRFKFGSSRSEDALTWTMFEGLRKAGRLDAVLPPAARGLETGRPPTVLAWGHPVAGSDGERIADALSVISNRLGEKVSSRSEPDLILAWPHLVVFVEVKLDSANDSQPGHRRFSMYLNPAADLYSNPAAVATAGFYELTRNWTIAGALAAHLGCSMMLINLGPGAVGHSAEGFSSLLRQNDRRRFVFRTWNDVVRAAAPLPRWLEVYLDGVALERSD